MSRLAHGRNNFVSADPAVAYVIQPWNIILNCPRPHNFKIIMGYIEKDAYFQHGDNCDLAHLAPGDRVCLFIPIRHDRGKDETDALDQSRYFISPLYAAQSISVIEWAAREMIAYEWFSGGPSRLDRRILFDLAPYFDGEDEVRPGVTKPMFRFDIHEAGSWTLKIERDGRDGLDGGEVDGDWDMVFTDTTPGAKPYTVGVTPANSAWAMSTFSPGGSPEETSELVVGLKPYKRLTGAPVEWPDRSRRVRNLTVAEARKIRASR